MRIASLKVFCCLIVLSLPGSVVLSQVLTVGPAVPLPDLPNWPQRPALAALPDGGFVVASSRDTSHRTSDFFFTTLSAEGNVLRSWQGGFGGVHRHLEMSMVGDGVLLTTLPRPDIVFLRSLAVFNLDPQAGEVLDAYSFETPMGFSVAYDVDVLSTGDMVSLWATAEDEGPEIALQVFAVDGERLGAPASVAAAEVSQVRVATQPGGGLLAVWRDEESGEVSARAYDSTLHGGPVRSVVAAAESAAEIDLVALANGTFVLVWSAVEGGGSSMIYARRLNAQGQPFDETIALGSSSMHHKTAPRVAADRFGRSWVVWQEHPMLGADEVHLRLLTASGVVSGGVRIPAAVGGDQLTPSIVINGEGRALVAWTERDGAGATAVQARTVEVAAMCAASDTVLCLHGERFRVDIRWTDYAGRQGPGRVLPFQSSDSGLFWFFEEKNWEVMVKVIDGCEFNGFFWVYSAATTDVAYELTVTDTFTGLHRTYSNELGVASPANTDTVALESCPLGPP